MRNIVISISFLVATLTNSAHAALPPKSESQLKMLAKNTVTGVVVGMSCEDVVTQGRGTNRNCRASIQVDSVEQGSITPEGQIVDFTFWKKVSWPEGYSGNGGQSQMMQMGSKVQVFANESRELIVPNGFKVVDEFMLPYYNAILESHAKSALSQWTITSITLTDTYRCIGCYRFDVVASKHGQTMTTSVETESHFDTNPDGSLKEIVGVKL